MDGRNRKMLVVSRAKPKKTLEKEHLTISKAQSLEKNKRDLPEFRPCGKDWRSEVKAGQCQ